MKELVQIAQNITKAVSSLIPFSISLSDENGILVGATEKERIGTFHPESKRVLNKGEFVEYEESEISHLDNVLPGIAMPLVFEQEIIGVIGVIGSPSEVQPYAKLIKQYVELMWYENFRKEVEDLESKINETYLQYILLKRTENDSKLIEYSQYLGLDINKQMLPIVIDIYDYLLKEIDKHVHSFSVSNLKKTITQKIQDMFPQEQQVKIFFMNTEKIVVIISIESIKEYFTFMDQFKTYCKNIIQTLSSIGLDKISIAAGGMSESILTLYSPYQEAINLLEQKTKQNSQYQILSFHDWDVVSALTPQNLDATFLDRLEFELTPLMEEKQYEDLKTSFITYCEYNMNVAKTAEQLYVHRNTLIYRLDKFEQLSRIDVKNFQHCSIVYMVLRGN